MTRIFHARDGQLRRAFRDAVLQPGNPASALRVAALRAQLTAGTPAEPGFAGYGAYGTYKPTPQGKNCGVREGSVLTPFYVGGSGEYRPKAGETLENLDIYGYIKINVANVTIRNCRIRGIPNPQAFVRLITNYDTYAKNTLIEDCTLIPDDPIGYVASTGLYKGHDGITGHDYTARRCLIQHCIDGFGIFNTSNRTGDSNVLIEGCYVGDHSFYSPTGAGDNTTHCDAQQVQGGRGGVMIGNNFQTFIDPAVAVNLDKNINGPGSLLANVVCMIKADVGAITDVELRNNWIDGGGSGINVYSTGPTGIASGNKFGRATKYPLIKNPNSPFVFENNTYEDNGAPVPTTRGT